MISPRASAAMSCAPRAGTGHSCPPLPPDIALDFDLARHLSAADHALGLLAGAAQTLPNPRLLSRTLVRREAVLSSRIEGTHASLSDLVLFEAEANTAAAREDVAEVYNADPA